MGEAARSCMEIHKESSTPLGLLLPNRKLLSKKDQHTAAVGLVVDGEDAASHFVSFPFATQGLFLKSVSAQKEGGNPRVTNRHTVTRHSTGTAEPDAGKPDVEFPD